MQRLIHEAPSTLEFKSAARSKRIVAEVEKAWAAEVERRIAPIECRRVQFIPARRDNRTGARRAEVSVVMPRRECQYPRARSTSPTIGSPASYRRRFSSITAAPD